MSRLVKLPDEIYNRRKKMSKTLDCTIGETFQITDSVFAQMVKKYNPKGRGKKQRFIIDVKK